MNSREIIHANLTNRTKARRLNLNGIAICREILTIAKKSVIHTSTNIGLKCAQISEMILE